MKMFQPQLNRAIPFLPEPYASWFWSGAAYNQKAFPRKRGTSISSILAKSPWLLLIPTRSINKCSQCAPFGRRTRVPRARCRRRSVLETEIAGVFGKNENFI